MQAKSESIQSLRSDMSLLCATISKNPDCWSIKLGLPPTMNEITNFMGRPLIEWSNFWEECLARITSQIKTSTNKVFVGEVWIEYRWVVKNWCRDPDNISASTKFINDGLVRAGVIKDDSLKIIQSPVIHHYQKRDKNDGQHDYVLVTISGFPPKIQDKSDCVDEDNVKPIDAVPLANIRPREFTSA